MNEKGAQPERRYDIVFRNVGNDCGPACGPELYDYWHVEAYDFERSWPLGIAFVADGTKSSSGTETAALLCFRLDYLFVIDEYRRQGVGTALLNAVKERWPSMCLDAATEDGERFLERVASPRGWAYQQRPRGASAMTSDPATNFRAFREIVGHVHATWTIWQILFGQRSSQETHDTLERASPEVFTYVRWHWLVVVTVELVKLDDPDQMHGRDNLTLQRIFDEAPFADDRAKRRAKQRMDRARDEIARMRRARNRVFSHNDLRAVTGIEKLLDRLTIESVEKAVVEILSFHQRIAEAHNGAPISVQSAEQHAPDATRWITAAARLLELIKQGLQVHKP